LDNPEYPSQSATFRRCQEVGRVLRRTDPSPTVRVQRSEGSVVSFLGPARSVPRDIGFQVSGRPAKGKKMSASNRRVGDLINDIEEDRLEIKPFFQRRLVWTNADKENFIDTVLKGYPFPEIFVATGILDRKRIKRQNWLVDGRQRITTLKDYVRKSTDLLY